MVWRMSLAPRVRLRWRRWLRRWPGLIPVLVLACAPARGPADAEADAIVVLLSADNDRHPDCNAVAIGPHELATAAHCVTHRIDQEDETPDAPRTAEIGDPVWYVTRAMWGGTGSGAERARVSYYDRVRDVALLETEGVPGPPRRVAELGVEAVYARSALYEWERHNGQVAGRTFMGRSSYYWETTIDIIPGWSGSPVFNASGAVVGLVSACAGATINAGTHQFKTCLPKFALVVDLPALVR